MTDTGLIHGSCRRQRWRSSNDYSGALEEGIGDVKRLFGSPQRGGLFDEPLAGCVIDFGCGFGRLMPGLAAIGFDAITGIDKCSASLRKGRELLPKMRFIQADCLAVIQDHSADFVFSRGVFINAAVNTVGLLQEIPRVLRPRGGFLLHSGRLHPADRPRIDRRCMHRPGWQAPAIARQQAAILRTAGAARVELFADPFGKSPGTYYLAGRC